MNVLIVQLSRDVESCIDVCQTRLSNAILIAYLYSKVRQASSTADT